jgi:hypothetical protein
MAHLFTSRRRCVPSLGSLALASVRHAPAIYRNNVALTEPDEYLALHQFLDASKAHMADFRHRALRHHSEGVYLLEKTFGPTITLSTGRVLPVRFIGEQHVMEDLGRIPTVADWLGRIQPESWMLGRGQESEV